MAERFRAVAAHDHRYGRLFPDGDVGNVIAGILAKQQELLDSGEVRALNISEVDLDELGAHFTFPVGEPMFLLRSSESCSRTALEDHLKICEENVGKPGGPTEEYTQGVRDSLVHFRTAEEAQEEQG